MFGLLGGEEDFSDTSNSDETDQDVDEPESNTDKSHVSDTTSPKKLPLPDLEVPLSQQGKVSVFSSQYEEEERAKEAVLERHVELSKAAPLVSKTQAKKEARKGHRSSIPRNRHIKCVSDEEQPKVKRKRQAGLSGTLQPPKKFMQSYHKQQAEEKPWLNKK